MTFIFGLCTETPDSGVGMGGTSGYTFAFKIMGQRLHIDEANDSLKHTRCRLMLHLRSADRPRSLLSLRIQSGNR
jgi:hypothetical protein